MSHYIYIYIKAAGQCFSLSSMWQQILKMPWIAIKWPKSSECVQWLFSAFTRSCTRDRISSWKDRNVVLLEESSCIGHTVFDCLITSSDAYEYFQFRFCLPLKLEPVWLLARRALGFVCSRRLAHIRPARGGSPKRLSRICFWRQIRHVLFFNNLVLWNCLRRIPSWVIFLEY